MIQDREALWIMAGSAMSKTVFDQDAADGGDRGQRRDVTYLHFMANGLCATWQIAVIETEPEEDYYLRQI